MRYVRGFGFPAPKMVHANGADTELKRLHGPTMVTALMSEALDMTRRPALSPTYTTGYMACSP